MPDAGKVNVSEFPWWVSGGLPPTSVVGMASTPGAYGARKSGTPAFNISGSTEAAEYLPPLIRANTWKWGLD
jgi:hypothetical protein